MGNTRNLSILTDESLMPFGKFQNTKMANVPYWHLLWLHNEKPTPKSYNAHVRKTNPEVFEYIEENMDALIAEKNKSLDKINRNTDYSAMFNNGY